MGVPQAYHPGNILKLRTVEMGFPALTEAMSALLYCQLRPLLVIGETRNLERTDIGEGTRFLVVSIRQHLLYLTRYLWETDNFCFVNYQLRPLLVIGETRI